jgi:hypothetical protein
VIRESCEKLARTLGFPEPSDPHQTRLTHPATFAPLSRVTSPVDAIFGNRYEEGGLFFRDACLTSEPVYDHRFQTRVCMNKILGTAKEKHLFGSEYALPSESIEEPLSSVISGAHRYLLCDSSEDPPLAYCVLVAGILSVDRIGGDKSTGSGSATIVIDAIEYNGQPISAGDVLDYLEYYAGLMPGLLSRIPGQEGRENS